MLLPGRSSQVPSGPQPPLFHKATGLDTPPGPKDLLEPLVEGAVGYVVFALLPSWAAPTCGAEAERWDLQWLAAIVESSVDAILSKTPDGVIT
jgi:hypothetical protein